MNQYIRYLIAAGIGAVVGGGLVLWRPGGISTMLAWLALIAMVLISLLPLVWFYGFHRLPQRIRDTVAYITAAIGLVVAVSAAVISTITIVGDIGISYPPYLDAWVQMWQWGALRVLPIATACLLVASIAIGVLATRRTTGLLYGRVLEIVGAISYLVCYLFVGFLWLIHVGAF